MSKVFYFPRYKGDENSITNTVLHLFTQIYGYSPYHLNTILNELLEAEVPLGLSFEQQKREKKSIPDGTISQESFTIRIETKVESGLVTAQLKNHCKNVTGENNYLLVVTKDPRDKFEVQKLKREVENVHIAHCTFNRLAQVAQDEFDGYETQIRPIVDDFLEFCTFKGLIPKEGILRAVPCGSSFDLNVKNLCYSHPAKRTFAEHDYLGLYKNKSVQMIGKIQVIVKVTEKDGELQFEPKNITSDIENRIRTMIEDTKGVLGWTIGKEGVMFFCVEDFQETDYRKTTRGGMQINRYLDISKELECSSSTKELAEKLSKVNWG